MRDERPVNPVGGPDGCCCGRPVVVLQFPSNALSYLIVSNILTAHITKRPDAEARALDDHMDHQADGRDAYALAADLIPKRGVAKLQSTAVRKLTRDAFRGSRARQSDL